MAYTHAQPGGLCAEVRDRTGAALDVLAHGHRTNSQTRHHQPTRTHESTSGYSQAAGGTGTGVQHIPPRRTEASPQTGARAAPTKTEAPPRGSGRLSPQGPTAQTGAQSGPSAAATRSTTEAEGPSMPAFHTGGTCRHAPRMARRRRSTRSIRSHA